MNSAGRKNTDYVFLRVYKGLHFLFTVLMFSFFWLRFRYDDLSKIILTKALRYDLYVVFLFALLLYLFSKTYNTYLVGYVRIRQLAFSQLIAQTVSTIVIIVLASVAWLKFKSPLIFILMLLPDALVDCLWSYSANLIFFAHNPTKGAILLYGDNDYRDFDLDITGKPVERMITITDELFCTEENIYEILDILPQYDAFFAVGISPECTKILTTYCAEEDAEGYFVPGVEDIIFRSAYHIQSFHEPVLSVRRKKNKLEYLIVKRAFDIFASGLGIIILSPVMLITAIAIKSYDGGPAIYKQTRLTTNGREFTIFKFRSMKVNAEQDGKAILSSGENDSRITPIGRIIRAIRFDELPQLFNIFMGDMTIVGPRPERPEIAEQYYETLPEFRLRLQVKAGLTGYAQVYGKYNTSPEQKLKFDLMYINSMNVLTDIRLMFATLGVLFTKESTEGVEKDQETAMAK